MISLAVNQRFYTYVGHGQTDLCIVTGGTLLKRDASLHATSSV